MDSGFAQEFGVVAAIRAMSEENGLAMRVLFQDADGFGAAVTAETNDSDGERHG